MNQNMIETFNLCLCLGSTILFMISNIRIKEWNTRSFQIYSSLLVLSTLTYMTDPFFHIIGLISAVVTSTIAVYYITEITNNKVQA